MGMIVQRERRSSGLVYPITTVTDGLQDVPLAGPRDFVFIGSGVNSVHRLLDARRYPLYAKVTFENATPEFVGVQNQIVAPATVATTWHRVPPRAKLECVLISKADAGGVWHSQVIRSQDPSHGYSEVADFNNSSTSYDRLGLTTYTANTGTGSIGGYSSPGRQGTVLLGTGTAANGISLVYSPFPNNYLGSGCRAFQMSQSVYALSTVGEEYIYRCGIFDTTTGDAPANGVYFYYDRANKGDFWVIRNINASDNSTFTTAIAPKIGVSGDNWQELRLEVDSSAARSDFWIDKTQVSAAGGLTDYLPATTIATKIAAFGITKSAGTTARYIRSDYVWVESYPTPPR
jgi:hypothetical protein